MDIKQAQKLQKNLQAKIGRMLDEFCHETGLGISNLGVSRIDVTQVNSDKAEYINVVWVEVSI